MDGLSDGRIYGWTDLRIQLVSDTAGGDTSFALEETAEGWRVLEAQSFSDVGEGQGAVAQQYFGMKHRVGIQQPHHRLAALLLDNCGKVVGRHAKLVGNSFHTAYCPVTFGQQVEKS